MNKKLQVFVSSTYTDLIEERQAAVEAILDAGHIPAGMELFKAGKSQMETIKKWIDESDVYMLILGGRYGSIEEDSGLSYTELEYKYALSKNMPVFTIVLDDSFLFTKAASKGKDAIFEKDNVNKYDSFKKFVETKLVKFIKNIEQIPTQIHLQLHDILNDSNYQIIGWTKDKVNTTNNTEIKIATLLDMSSPTLSIIKDKIKTVSKSVFIDKTIKIKHLENFSHLDILNIALSFDIFIFDVSNIYDSDIFLLGYVTALKKHVILICDNKHKLNFSLIETCYPLYSSTAAVFYEKNNYSHFTSNLKFNLEKYIE